MAVGTVAPGAAPPVLPGQAGGHAPGTVVRPYGAVAGATRPVLPGSTGSGAPRTIVGGGQGRRSDQGDGSRRRIVASIAGGALALVAVVAVFLLTRGGGSDDEPQAAVGRTQTTLLFMITGQSGKAIESALLAHDPATGQGAIVLVPSSMVADVPGRGQLPFGNVAAYGGKVPAETLGDVMGVTVDGTLRLNQAAFAQLIDRQGGITVPRVDTDVMQSLPHGRERLLVERGGERHLNGQQAVAYATYRKAGENEQARLARMTNVLTGLVAATSDPTRAATSLEALGGRLRSTLPAARLGTVLAGLHTDDGADKLAFEVLPVQPVGTGADLYAPATDEIEQLVRRYLAASVPPGRASGHNRVIVVNGTGALGLGETAHGRLTKHGLVFVHSENQQGFSFRDRPSVVLVPDDSAASRTLGHRVASALGLPDRDIAINRQPTTAADVVVILGADYHP